MIGRRPRRELDRAAAVLLAGHTYQVNGAQMALIRDGRVLIQLRPWPPGWEMPGGHCEPDEDPADCAVRETEEETGHRVALRGLVGVYMWRGWRGGGDALYLGEIVGGRPRRSIESVRTRFVDATEYPRTVFPWIPQRIEDALAVSAGAQPRHRVQPVSLQHVLFFAGQWLAVPVDLLRRLSHDRQQRRNQR